jgi:hypothetical protein
VLSLGGQISRRPKERPTPGSDTWIKDKERVSAAREQSPYAASYLLGDKAKQRVDQNPAGEDEWEAKFDAAKPRVLAALASVRITAAYSTRSS